MIKKAIIPAAGYGTRGLPITKVVPKELFPIGVKPAIHYVVEEAMASGLPVVSTQHAGIPELIEHQRTGYLAPENNDMELAKGIQFFLEHPEVWNDYTQRARKVIEEKFDVNKQIIEQQRSYSLIKKSKNKPI